MVTFWLLLHVAPGDFLKQPHCNLCHCGPFITLCKANELSTYAVQRDCFKQELLHTLQTISHSVVR